MNLTLAGIHVVTVVDPSKIPDNTLVAWANLLIIMLLALVLTVPAGMLSEKIKTKFRGTVFFVIWCLLIIAGFFIVHGILTY